MKILFAIAAILSVLVLGSSIAGIQLGAQSTPTGLVTPPIFPEGTNNCELGQIGACNDSGQYVSGPESVLSTWIFSEAVPWWISFFLVLAAGVSVLMIMMAGIAITVGGDSEIRKQQGIKTIIWSVAGLVISLLAFGIIAILENIPLPGATTPSPTEQQP